MSEYEITYLADPKLDEEAKTKLDEAVDREITDREGIIGYSLPSNAPGSRRRLHFPILGQRVAWMRVLHTQLAPEHITPIRQNISKQEHILRVNIVQKPRSEEVSPKLMELLSGKTKELPVAQVKPAATKPVTMEDVEERIEKALEEEVK